MHARPTSLRLALTALIALIATAAAQANAQPCPTGTPADPLAFCADRIALAEDDGTPIGELCVVQPSCTDTAGLGVLDLDPDCELEPDGH